MEQDFQLAPKEFWLSFQWLRRGERNPVHMVFSVGGELLISTESIVGLWKEYFKNFLNPTNTYSEEEAEPKDFGPGSLITGVEVAWAVKLLHSRSAG